MSAIVIMVSQGAIALGAVVWGFCAQAAGVSVALVVAAIALSFSLFLVTQLSIDCTTTLSFDPPPISCVMSPLVYNPQPGDGPVVITFELEVEQPRSREFLRLMRELRLIHLRNGAFGWRLDEDLTRCNTYRVELMVPSWTGYQLQRQRLTKAEQEIIKKLWCLHVGEHIPLERYHLCVNRELMAQARTEAQPSIVSASPLDLGIPFKRFGEYRDE
jgi:Transmembrane secretion effector